MPMFLKSPFWMLILSASTILAQEPQTTDSVPKGTPLKEVRSTGMHINDSLMNAPASIGILSQRNLRSNNHSDISTEMNTLPGIFMQTSNLTTNRIKIRGIGARTPYGTNKIKAFYGGIPLTSGDSKTTI
jgi:iron complex outermembrane receptor protein